MEFNLSRNVPELVLAQASSAPAFSPEPGLMRRILASNDNLMLVEHRMSDGWVGTRHSHPHDQLVYIIEGRLRVSVGSETFEAPAGTSFIVKGDVEHQAWALAPSLVLDSFTPRRRDYLPAQG